MQVGDLVQEVITHEHGNKDGGRIGIVREVDPIDRAFCAIWVSWVGGGWQELDWDCLYSPDFIILSKVAK